MSGNAETDKCACKTTIIDKCAHKTTVIDKKLENFLLAAWKCASKPSDYLVCYVNWMTCRNKIQLSLSIGFNASTYFFNQWVSTGTLLTLSMQIFVLLTRNYPSRNTTFKYVFYRRVYFWSYWSQHYRL